MEKTLSGTLAIVVGLGLLLLACRVGALAGPPALGLATVILFLIGLFSFWGGMLAIGVQWIEQRQGVR